MWTSIVARSDTRPHCRLVVILQVIQAGSGELIRIVVTDDTSLVHDRCSPITIAVIEIERMTQFVSSRAQILLVVAADGRVLVVIYEPATSRRVVHQAKRACGACSVGLFLEMIYHDPIGMIPRAHGGHDAPG